MNAYLAFALILAAWIGLLGLCGLYSELKRWQRRDRMDYTNQRYWA